MPNYTSRTWAELDLAALRRNYASLRNILGGTRMMCAVKANAYGHGAVAVARCLAACGADSFAVATPEEAFELRDGGVTLPILVLGASVPAYVSELIARDITQCVPSLDHALAYSEAAAGGTLRVHAKVDTGMGRLGFLSALDLARAMALPALDFEGVFTHFAVADEVLGAEYTRRQFDAFTAFVETAERSSDKRFRIRHCSNSAAAIANPEFRLDLTREGLALYGYAPIQSAVPLDLRPVMSLKTRVAQVKSVRAGDKISYGGTWTAKRDGTVAVLPVGYGDGLHRILSNKLQVLINGQLAQQIGTICMDMCMVDITDVPNVRVGDVVTVFGQSPALTAADVAALCGTISYEMLCAPSARVPRIYIE
ncbi:MAG: alanine racemase [Oscillospiraceae bacterium]|jgi:alanine racemase|nr:alanine racemase [Oscillospiraceae bacterium]